MPQNVVVVESPAKAKTIEKYLGKDFKVIASYGHIRDLPKSKMGIDIEHDFAPQYIIPKGSAKNLKALKTALASAKTIYLATDYDREGEAIAWHILEAVPPAKGQTVERITFTEITKPAITEAIRHPRSIDTHLVDAQQARRVVDRLVGYTLSPVLWKKVRGGLSAGRVQSVALKLIVDRERDITAFVPVEYWSITAGLTTDKSEQFQATLTKISGQKADIHDAKTAATATRELKSGSFTVSAISRRELKKTPSPPFITSSLQQEAYRKLGFGSRKTMMVAQNLYEAGHITYMRTDSFNLAPSSTAEAKDVITKLYDQRYALESPRFYKKKVRNAQEAHEAIRPTSFQLLPDQLGAAPDEVKLYRLIWQRALATQMSEAQFQQRGADIASGKYQLRATGQTTLFDGFTVLYQESQDDAPEETNQVLPELAEGQKLALKEVKPEQHFTAPPPRFTEASLIKLLEEQGIGRPSTYAPTISTIVARGYIRSENKRLFPEEVGFLVTDLLAKHFPFVVDARFTATMESKLDDVADGSISWQPVVREFYEPLAHQVKTETDKIERTTPQVVETDQICELDGGVMVIKQGRFGPFLACRNWPECKNTKPILTKIDVPCPKDGGDVVQKRTKKGRTFWGCANWPKCDYATWQKPSAPAGSE